MEIKSHILEEASEKLRKELLKAVSDYKPEISAIVYDNRHNEYTVTSYVDDKTIGVHSNSHRSDTQLKISEIKSDVSIQKIGANPFKEMNDIRFMKFGLESIFGYLGIGRRERETIESGEPLYANFDPYFVEDDGSKTHYQRGLVWTLEQKQALIDTVYRGLDAGRVIIHDHGYDFAKKMQDRGFKDFAQRDVVDGKQRLTTLIEFHENKFPDSYGNFFGDLSPLAKIKFRSYDGLAYGEISSRTKEPLTKEEILSIFINNVVAGTPLDKEHLDYVKSLMNK